MKTRTVLTAFVAFYILIIVISVMFFPVVAVILSLAALGVYVFGYEKRHGRGATVRELFKELFFGW